MVPQLSLSCYNEFVNFRDYEGICWKSLPRIMETLIPFPGLPSPGRGMSEVVPHCKSKD